MYQSRYLITFTILLALLACSKAHEETSNNDNTASINVIESEKAINQVKKLVIYSSRKEQLVQPLFDAYTKKTGTEITFLTDKAEPLTQKLMAEGQQTPADILMTVDAGNLSRAASANLLQAVDSVILEKWVPVNLQDPDNQWFGLSKRARTLVYSSERVQPDELSSYEGLAASKWKQRLCLRTAKKVYNQSLVAMLIAKHGIAKTEAIVKGWVANLATAPFSNDTKAMEAIVAGQCDVTVVNTYYLGRLLKQNPDLPLKIFWPNQNDADDQLSGVHVNVSGAGIVKHAKNPTAAKDFLEWLVTDEAQSILANGNLEYPVTESVALDPLVKGWGSFIADNQNIADAGAIQPEAVKLMDRAGYY